MIEVAVATLAAITVFGACHYALRAHNRIIDAIYDQAFNDGFSECEQQYSAAIELVGPEGFEEFRSFCVAGNDRQPSRTEIN